MSGIAVVHINGGFVLTDPVVRQDKNIKTQNLSFRVGVKSVKKIKGGGEEEVVDVYYIDHYVPMGKVLPVIKKGNLVSLYGKQIFIALSNTKIAKVRTHNIFVIGGAGEGQLSSININMSEEDEKFIEV